jgi:hypothetical protein
MPEATGAIVRFADNGSIPQSVATQAHAIFRQVNRTRLNTLQDRGSHGLDASQT